MQIEMLKDELDEVKRSLADYVRSAALNRKKRELGVSLIEVQIVGGRHGGLRPSYAKRLYISLLRPKIEFGITTLPYNADTIDKLEKLQIKCLKQLFGFLPKTKHETIRAITGVSSMRCRFATLKTNFAHKILSMSNDHLVKTIFKTNWNSSAGLGADLRSISRDWFTDAKLMNLCENVRDGSNCEDPHTTFKNTTKREFERRDFERCREELQASANRSGQARRILTAIARQHCYMLIPQLLTVQVPRYQMVIYTNVLSGCDFVTPFLFSKKPTCKFCGSANTTWEHLLFHCPDRKSGHHVLTKFVDSLKIYSNRADDRLKELFGKAVRICATLWSRKDFGELFLFMMGVTLYKYDLDRINFAIMKPLVSTMSALVHSIEYDWSHFDS